MRPSGSTITLAVMKRGPAGDVALQADLQQHAGPDLAPFVYSVSADPGAPEASFIMECGRHIRETSAAYSTLLKRISEVWSREPRRVCTSQEYFEYVCGRLDACPPTLAARLRPTLCAAVSAPHVAEFVHGDATMANTVSVSGRLMFIDFSPKPSPPDRRIDVAKILMSAALENLLYTVIAENSKPLKPYIDQGSGLITDKCVQYYMATHFARVGSREPEKVEKLHQALDSVERRLA